MKEQRRSILKKLFATVAGVTGITLSASAKADDADKKEVFNVVTDITAHTKHVLDELEKELIKAGSSMQKVLKVSVFLHDLNDYKAMNEAYKGRFGDKPPVRTTVAVYGGVPGDSLVEMDCIAYI
jgi:enamine deaminase RidA (YjgF/YER057c/UK114 family)